MIPVTMVGIAAGAAVESKRQKKYQRSRRCQAWPRFVTAGTGSAESTAMVSGRHASPFIVFSLVASLAGLVACSSPPEEEDSSEGGSSALFGLFESYEIRDMDGQPCRSSKDCGKGGTCTSAKFCDPGEDPRTTNCKVFSSPYDSGNEVCQGGKKKWTKVESKWRCDKSCANDCELDGFCVTKPAEPIDEPGDGKPVAD